MTEISLDSKIPGVKKTDSTSIARNVENSPSINSPVEQILFLQRTIGNHAVGRIIRSRTLQVLQKNGDPDVTYTPIITAEREAQAAADADKANKAMDAAGHKEESPSTEPGEGRVETDKKFPPQWFMKLQKRLSSTNQWEKVEEDAQKVLRDYANDYLRDRLKGANIPPHVRTFFEYIGRSSRNDDAAKAGKDRYKAVSDIGGGRGIKDWCTNATTSMIIRNLREMGYKPKKDILDVIGSLARVQGEKGKMKLWGPDAYPATLKPGDQVMYLWNGAQHGGHTVTVIDDLDGYFTHISGNATGGGVMVSRSKHITTPPPGFNLDKCLEKPEKKENTNTTVDKAKIFMKTLNFDNGNLVYSIVRFSEVFTELEKLSSLTPDEKRVKENEILPKFHLTLVTP